MGRPRIHKNEAERMQAFRAKYSRIDLTLPIGTGETLQKISDSLGVKKTELVESMIQFALTNRNWAAQGLMPKAK